MVEGGAGPEFPVVFFDGEREMNIGSIRVYPMLEFKAFQLMLSQRIGISPNQISIYLCDRKSSKFEDRRRIPITGKANFGLIAREKDCFFLVVLKRSRKLRNRKAAAKAEFGGGFMTENEFPVNNLILLRRTQPEMNLLGFRSPFYDQISPELENLNDNYSVDRYLMHLNNPYPDPDPDPFPRIQDTFPMMTKNSLMEKKANKCVQCKGNNENEKNSGFHHCINDPVIIGGFRSRFGPVRRTRFLE
ncbi:hypothetical protein RND71_007161 [Anisodus tanguticus]|uniref:DUF7138 domain-containing protein n=1 Tax=Anisodus tanguticus TaxID=243964 RepID=A0AAE1SLU5_9SOLA|nr:hypothetical protein RND71_007161 [Anisodus tanguticus]